MRSFKHRLLILIVTLMALAQGVTIVLALAYLDRGVRTEAAHQLKSTRATLDKLLESRAAQLDSASRVLVADFAFREAVATGDRATMLSALANHANRIRADMAIIYDADGKQLATTLPDRALASVAALHLPDDSKLNTTAAIYAVLDKQPFELVFAPVRSPTLIGWVALGFSLDRQLAAQLGKIADTEVSFVVHTAADQEALVISTLPANDALRIAGSLKQTATGNEPIVTQLDGSQYLTTSAPLSVQNGAVSLVVQRSLADAQAQTQRMRLALWLIGGAALLGAILVAWLAGRSAVKPLNKLVSAAQRVEAGDYERNIDVGGGEEFERLAHTFNAMQQGIREREARILQQASHDALTGLPNRVALRNYMLSLANDPRTFSIAVLDVQRFRDINASLGHALGDQLLQALAKHLPIALPAAIHIARVGADQFAVLLPLHDSQVMHRMLLLCSELQQGLQVGEQRLVVSLHIGISEWREPRAPVNDWMRQADVALLESKEHGPAVTTYQDNHDAEHKRRILLVSELRRALNNGGGEGLTLMYQPLVQMTNRDPVSFEALLRWNHPTLGNISPAEFIPLAERASVIADLTRWVLRAATTQLGQWRRQGFETEVAVNLSAADITDPLLAQYLMSLLREHDVPTKQLLLEVTESAIMHEPQLAAQNMQQLRSLGVRFAIDDFGTGHSSLAQLHALPVDELKLDRAFVHDVDRSASNAAIVRATTELGHNLGLKVVAEGVETPEAWNMLLRLGCDLVQGYFISRPMAANAVVEWTRHHRANLSQQLDEAAQDGTVTNFRARTLS